TPPARPTRGLILSLNYKNMSVAIDRTYYHDPLLYVSHRGNLQQLPNGNQLVGWGEEPYISEFQYAGNQEERPYINMIYDMEYHSKNYSYRAFKYNWTG